MNFWDLIVTNAELYLLTFYFCEKCLLRILGEIKKSKICCGICFLFFFTLRSTKRKLFLAMASLVPEKPTRWQFKTPFLIPWVTRKNPMMYCCNRHRKEWFGDRIFFFYIYLFFFIWTFYLTFLKCVMVKKKPWTIFYLN